MSPKDLTPPNPQIACSKPVVRHPASPCNFLGLHIHWQAAALSSCGTFQGETFDDGPLVPAQAAESLEQISDLKPEADSDWSCCNLKPLQEAKDSELA